jgi:hypothetical protein
MELQEHQLRPLALRRGMINFLGSEGIAVPANASFNVGNFESNMTET